MAAASESPVSFFIAFTSEFFSTEIIGLSDKNLQIVFLEKSCVSVPSETFTSLSSVLIPGFVSAGYMRQSGESFETTFLARFCVSISSNKSNLYSLVQTSGFFPVVFLECDSSDACETARVVLMVWHMSEKFD